MWISTWTLDQYTRYITTTSYYYYITLCRLGGCNELRNLISHHPTSLTSCNVASSHELEMSCVIDEMSCVIDVMSCVIDEMSCVIESKCVSS